MRRATTLQALFIAAMLLIVVLTVHRWIWRHGTPPPLDELFPVGEIVIGVDGSFAPFASVGVDGALVGLDIDLGRALGERIGLPVRFVNMGYDGLYDSLESGQVDLLISALVVDPLRTADVYYTWAYFNAGLVLVSATEIDSMRDLPGRSLAYEYGSTADSEARLWLRRIAPFESRPYETPQHALDAVRLGHADAALVDATTARLYLREHAAWSADYVQVTASLYSAAVRIDRRWLWRLVNREMLALLNDGTIDALLMRWL
jgi:polar amino acid transport system substrate-binding protein